MTPRVHLRQVVLLCSILLMGTSCSTGDIVNQPFSSVEQEKATDGYETPPTFKATDILPDTFLSSDDYRIQDEVLNNGYNNFYHISSDYGFFEAKNASDLKRIVREIKAITALRSIVTSRELSDSIEDSAKTPFRITKELLFHPIDTVTGVPLGALKFTRRLGGLLVENRSELEDSRTKELIGFSTIKRQYAYYMGIDVYSDTLPLQENLNHVSWITFSGNLPMRVAYAFIPHPGGLIASGTFLTEDLNNLLLTSTPEDLRYHNRQKLTDINTPLWLEDKFIGHSWLSPRHQTSIILSLLAMEKAKGRQGLIELATRTHNRKTSDFTQTMLSMLADAYKEHPFKVVHTWNDLALGQTDDDTLVLALPADYMSWTEHVAKSFASIDRHLAKPLGIKAKELRLSGDLSPRAKTELTNLGWSVITHQDETTFTTQ